MRSAIDQGSVVKELCARLPITITNATVHQDLRAIHTSNAAYLRLVDPIIHAPVILYVWTEHVVAAHHLMNKEDFSVY